MDLEQILCFLGYWILSNRFSTLFLCLFCIIFCFEPATRRSWRHFYSQAKMSPAVAVATHKLYYSDTVFALKYSSNKRFAFTLLGIE